MAPFDLWWEFGHQMSSAGPFAGHGTRQIHGYDYWWSSRKTGRSCTKRCSTFICINSWVHGFWLIEQEKQYYTILNEVRNGFGCEFFNFIAVLTDVFEIALSVGSHWPSESVHSSESCFASSARMGAICLAIPGLCSGVTLESLDLPICRFQCQAEDFSRMDESGDAQRRVFQKLANPFHEVLNG